MLRLVVHARRTPEILARIVLLFHRRKVSILSLSADCMGDCEIRVYLTLDLEHSDWHRTDANLHKLIDVLSVKQVTDREPMSVAINGTGKPAAKVVYVVTTGGTIEKVYSENAGALTNSGHNLESYLQCLRLPYCEVHTIRLMNIDSLEMTKSDRELILGTVTALLSENMPIVVTHGTDTMVETGLYLLKSIPNLQVPIVLTGAMRPLGLDASDGLQNLTESLLAARVLQPGVFIVMHNEMFPIHRVRKDRLLGRFVWTDENLV